MSSGLSTKSIGTSEFTPKLLQPGNRVVQITKVALEAFPYIENSYNLLVECVGPDMGPEFEGFYIDNNNQALGKHKGQIGRIKGSEWAYANGKTKSGVEISRDVEIMKFLKNLCTGLNSTWLDDADGKYGTIEEMILAFNDDAPFEGKFLNVCIAGREYLNNKGYMNYDLYFPRPAKGKVVFELESVTTSKLLPFDEVVHIKKAATPKEVSEFGDVQGSANPDTFEL